MPHARRVVRANLHLTIAFIGDMDPEPAARVAARLRRLQVDAFTWAIDKLGVFAGARVAWAGGRAPAELLALVGAVQDLLAEESVRFDRRPYVPHVTLLRQLPRATPGLARAIDPPVLWTVRAPVLLHSASGRYVEVAPAG